MTNEIKKTNCNNKKKQYLQKDRNYKYIKSFLQDNSIRNNNSMFIMILKILLTAGG